MFQKVTKSILSHGQSLKAFSVSFHYLFYIIQIRLECNHTLRTLPILPSPPASPPSHHRRKREVG